MGKKWIAIDWGTSNFRAWLMNDVRVKNHIARPCGLLNIDKNAFAQTLYGLLGGWLRDAPPLLMAGMVGSQQGWREAPYCPLPADSASLSAHRCFVATPWGSPAWIIPGVSGLNALGLPDVMRGEEVQLLGLATLSRTVRRAILPGTHSKHARLEAGAIRDFSTFMTGELFALLVGHSLLGRDLSDAGPDDEAFRLGVRHSQLDAPQSQLLFSARTLRLGGDLPASGVRDYLSGLLIGAELRHSPRKGLAVVGAETLCERYRMAAEELGITLRFYDGDRCFLAGMTLLYHSLKGED